jgi:hypothetical protein
MEHFRMASLLQHIQKKVQSPITVASPVKKRRGKQARSKSKSEAKAEPEAEPKVEPEPEPEAEAEAEPVKKKAKQKIPVALREQVWIYRMGRSFEGKCPVTWCQNRITVFDFQSGHNIPESRGGPTNLENLIPLCSRCNLSMGDKYTIDEWCQISPEKTVVIVAPVQKRSWLCCFS